jgi:tetratricopeptide (TPR) repeat protein
MPRSPRITLAALRRARLLPVVVFYGSAAFVVLQVCDIFVSQFGLPSWVFPTALVLLLAGFPVVVATALVYGAQREASADTGGRGAGAALDAAGAGGGGADAGRDADASGGASRSLRLPALLARLTWSRTLAGGGAAFALLILLVAGYAGSRALGVGPFATLLAAGVLSDREVLVVAEFEARGTSPDMGRTVTEAVRVDLGQSGSILLLDGERVREALARMGRGADEPLVPELARELAIREGVKAVVAGEIAAAGSGYLLVARVLAAGDGSMLVAVRETAASDAHLIDAIDRLSRGLRERIGEPLRSLAARPPLAQTTTSSLEALQLYARAVPISRQDPARALPLFEEAVRLDPAFVAAWYHIAAALEQVGAPTSAIRQAALRGSEHLDRLTGVERYLFQGLHQARVLGDLDGQLRTYATMADLYPDERLARLNLASRLGRVGETLRALDLLAPLVAAPEPPLLTLLVASNTLVWHGRPDSAVALLERQARHIPDHPMILRARLNAEGAARDYGAVERTAQQLVETATFPLARVPAVGAVAALAAQRGREDELVEAMTGIGEVTPDLERAGPAGQPGWLLFWRSAYREIRQRDREGLRALLVGIELPEPGDSLSAMDQPFLHLAQAWALAGDVDRARHYLDRARRWWPEGLLRAERAGLRTAEALIALQEGRLDEAEAALTEGRFDDCPRCLLPLVARAREAAGQPERALELWDLYDATKHSNSLYADGIWVPELYEARARLKERLGDRAGAANELRLALAAFSDADPVHDSRIAAWLRDLRRLE